MNTKLPIFVDSPTAKELMFVKNRTRATSLVYEHLLARFGVGTAEHWLESLDLSRGSDLISIAARAMSPSGGWILSATNTSERIAKK